MNYAKLRLLLPVGAWERLGRGCGGDHGRGRGRPLRALGREAEPSPATPVGRHGRRESGSDVVCAKTVFHGHFKYHNPCFGHCFRLFVASRDDVGDHAPRLQKGWKRVPGLGRWALIGDGEPLTSEEPVACPWSTSETGALGHCTDAYTACAWSRRAPALAVTTQSKEISSLIFSHFYLSGTSLSSHEGS